MARRAYLLLKDGTVYEGVGLGADGVTIGEVVFNTSMTGYQEIITDPSYAGQIVTFTYPLLGNYGTNAEDVESQQPHLRGVVIKAVEADPSNFRNLGALDNYLKQHNIVGLAGVDTRALTKHIRQFGVINGAIIVAETLDETRKAELMHQIDAFSDQEMIASVSPDVAYDYDSGGAAATKYKVVAFDFGMKTNILRLMAQHGFEIHVVPHDTDFETIDALNPDGIFLSNGPGDPKSIPQSIATIRRLIEAGYPVMGICLGHQLIALALGGDTYKLKFGHRGANHPVQDVATKKVYITSQNHGYAVDDKSLAGTGLEVTHINLNDRTVEGMRHTSKPVFCVQYHPEASAGPQDSYYLFEEFIRLVEGSRR